MKRRTVGNRLFHMLLIMLLIGTISLSAVCVNAASQADDIISIAESYEGKSLEQVRSAMKSKGFSMYLPNYNADWCAWFVSNCARQAGISTSVVENNTYADRLFWQNNKLYQKGKYYGGSYTPQKGDLIFFDWDLDDVTDHVGLVRSVSGATVYTIEGNSSNSVRKKSYALNSKNILGYGTPKYSGSTTKTYTIRYNANGGTGSMSDQKMTYGVSANLKLNTFTKPGYTFKCWYAKRNSDGKWNCYGNGKWDWFLESSIPSGYSKAAWKNGGSDPGKDTTVNGDIITCYAQWTPNTYTIKYNANGGAGSMSDTGVTYGTNHALRANTFTRPGYRFIGWNAYRASDKKWASYSSSENKWGWYTDAERPSGYVRETWKDAGSLSGRQSTVNGDTITCYAQWEPIAYTIKYNANGGTGSMADQKITYEEKPQPKLKKNVFTKAGYTFDNWFAYRASDQKWYYANSDHSNSGWYVEGGQPSGWQKQRWDDGGAISAKDSVVNGDTVILYAQWKKNSGTQPSELAAPTITSVVNTVNGPKITWNRSQGAKGYSIYTKSANGTYTKIASVSGEYTLTYTHGGAVSGTKYTYVVKADGSGTSSDYSTGKTITYLAAPRVSSVVNSVNGPRITWTKSPGAQGYIIYTKSSNGTLNKIGTVSGDSTLAYTHNTAVSGNSYTYIVRANGPDISSYYSAGRTIYYLSSPRITGVVNSVNGPKITWSKSPGAKEYIIYTKASDGTLTKIGSVTGDSNLSFFHNGAVSGKAYTYIVRANGANISSFYEAGRTITYLASPRVASATNAKTGPKITWNKISGATSYVILRKEGSGEYGEIGRVSGGETITFVDASAVNGKTYIYAVRANGKNISSYYSAGKSIKCSK